LTVGGKDPLGRCHDDVVMMMMRRSTVKKELYEQASEPIDLIDIRVPGWIFQKTKRVDRYM